MHVGVFIGTQHTADTDIARAATAHIRQTALMAELGYHSVWLGQHYLTYPEQFLQLTPLLARLSAESGDMLLGTNLLLLPLQNPLDVAEQYATIDVLSGGRLVLGVGLGYRDAEYHAFGVDRRRRTARFEEALHLLRRLWEEDDVTFDGDFYQVANASVRPRPLQRPRPPIWIGATADPAIRRAARLGDAWIATSMTLWSEVKAQRDLYVETRRAEGLAPAERLAKCVELFVLPDREEAMRTAERYMMAKSRAYYRWGMGGNVPGDSGSDLAFADLVRDRFVVGNPDDCVRDCRYHRDELGVTDLLIRVNFPGMSEDQVAEQLRLFASDVLPALAA